MGNGLRDSTVWNPQLRTTVAIGPPVFTLVVDFGADARTALTAPTWQPLVSFSEMCSGSEAGSYLRLIDFVYHSTLHLRVIKQRRCPFRPDIRAKSRLESIAMDKICTRTESLRWTVSTKALFAAKWRVQTVLPGRHPRLFRGESRRPHVWTSLVRHDGLLGGLLN